MNFCSFTPELLPQALELLRYSDSTSRSQETWEANHLTAVMAFDGSRVVGLIPLEPRSFKMDGNRAINALWVSGAHVQEDYRSKGVGTALDAQISVLFPDAQAVFAYRQDEGSRAYQWYMKMGYKPMSLILAFKKAVTSPAQGIEYTVDKTLAGINSCSSQLLALFNQVTGSYGGYPQRSSSFWGHIYAFHYYREFYQYALLTIQKHGKICAYAFVGETSMRDDIKRIDILELIASADKIQEMLEVVMAYASQKGLQELRIQCEVNDPLKEVLLGGGFILRWQTNILGKELKKGILDQKSLGNWRYFQIEYI